jgi:hypothetical protein
LYSIYDAKENAMVLSAACFCHGTEAEVGMGFLSWMAVAQTYPHVPRGVDRLATLGNWSFHDRHYYQAFDNGIAPSPRQKETNEVLEGVEMFLQSTTPQAFQFYRSCGIKQINHRNEDNREILHCLSKNARKATVLCCGGLVFWAMMSNFLVCCTCHQDKC